MAPRFRLSALYFFFLALTAHAATAGDSTEDHRAWQHGVNLIQVGEKLLVVWGSAGNPPRPNLGGDWPHDVYYAWADAAKFDPQVLVSLPEAQEPPSVALNSRGTLLMTSEDGNGGINQHAGIWNSKLQALKKYPFTIRRGGHSGHVAAMGERFLVVYGEGWVDGGGWNGLGTGQDIHARIVENDGTLRGEVALATGHRDSWPLVASSDRNWLAVWQRYPDMTLQSALIDATGKVVQGSQITGGLPLRYAYDVGYSPQLGAFVVAGSSGSEGFVALVSLAGEIVKLQRGLPPMASESRMVFGREGGQTIGVYPVAPRGVAVVRLSTEAIALARRIDHPYAWDYSGTAGAFVAPGRVLFATLSTTGLRLIPVDLSP